MYRNKIVFFSAVDFFFLGKIGVSGVRLYHFFKNRIFSVETAKVRPVEFVHRENIKVNAKVLDVDKVVGMIGSSVDEDQGLWGFLANDSDNGLNVLNGSGQIGGMSKGDKFGVGVKDLDKFTEAEGMVFVEAPFSEFDVALLGKSLPRQTVGFVVELCDDNVVMASVAPQVVVLFEHQ